MYFGTKNYLKSTHNHTVKHALILWYYCTRHFTGQIPSWFEKDIDNLKQTRLQLHI
jgi:hypothetical protein